MNLARLVAEARPAVHWTDQPDAPDPRPPLRSGVSTDLCVVGGGFTGLWAALQALEEQPGRRVVVLEAETCGFGASTRNGGFADVSLTHGVLNGLAHWPDDFDTLERLGRDNLDNLLATVDRYAIACHAHRADEVAFATAGWQLDDLTEEAETLRQHGLAHTLMDQSAAQARVHSPTFHGGLAYHDTLALLDPARLVWGLADAVESLGGIIHDGTRVEGIDDTNGRLTVRSGTHTVVADRVIVATNAWAEPIRQMRRYIVPVYDHVLMTEPLTSEQLEAIGWADRAGLNDSGHQFHYYRRTHDDRILWGGYDANYYFGNGMGPKYEDRRSSHELIAGHFFETFPQLEGLGFSHRWAGPIGTTSKFAATYGTRFDGRLSWVGGYTGLGVGASRFGARVALDLVDGLETERTALRMVRRKPIPFPPEPLRSLAIQTTRRAIAKADRTGEEGRLLRTLARFGVGFDS